MKNSLEICIWKLIVKEDFHKPEQLRMTNQYKKCLKCDGFMKECSMYKSFGNVKISYLKYKMEK